MEFVGSDDLFKKRRNTVDLKRKQFCRGEARDRVLIVTEGSKTEPYYLSSFRLTNVTIKGCGYNTDSLVQHAIELKKNASKNREPYHQVWCVFDRDSFPAEGFRTAFKLAELNGIYVAYTNEAFELWYMLHFNFYDSALSRHQYGSILSKLLGFSYQKNDSGIYDRLLPLQDVAIHNAEALLRRYDPLDPESHNPSTTVHHLVKYLNQWTK